MHDPPLFPYGQAMTTTASQRTESGSAGRPRLGSRLGAFAAVVAVSIALPLVFLREDGPSWFHLVFHLLGIIVCALGVLILRGVRQATTSRTLRVLTWVSTVAFAGWAVGHTGELVTVLTHGGPHADHELFEHPVHMFFATIAVPSWMLTVLSSLVLLITAGVRAIIRAVRR
jgi:hypothetical protein